MQPDEVAELLAPWSYEVRQLALELRALVERLVPDATEELDPSAGLIAFTFQPGTYKGLFVAIAPQKSYVNLMFSKGVELLDLDSTHVLEGTGKKARHIKFHDRERLTDPGVRTLIEEAAKRTPRG
jgi:hypothetical protein